MFCRKHGKRVGVWQLTATCTCFVQPHSQRLFFFLNAFMPVHDSRTINDNVHIQEVSTAAENQSLFFSWYFCFSQDTKCSVLLSWVATPPPVSHFWRASCLQDGALANQTCTQSWGYFAFSKKIPSSKLSIVI